jgi:hypothetical protein
MPASVRVIAFLGYDPFHHPIRCQRFLLKDAADAHKALEARATSSSTILTI